MYGFQLSGCSRVAYQLMSLREYIYQGVPFDNVIIYYHHQVNMWLSFNKLLLLASVASTTSASPSFVQRDGVDYTVYNHAATGSKLEIIKNSAICETTPGVNQYSGYFSVGQNMSMWFWYVSVCPISPS